MFTKRFALILNHLSLKEHNNVGNLMKNKNSEYSIHVAGEVPHRCSETENKHE